MKEEAAPAERSRTDNRGGPGGEHTGAGAAHGPHAHHRGVEQAEVGRQAIALWAMRERRASARKTVHWKGPNGTRLDIDGAPPNAKSRAALRPARLLAQSPGASMTDGASVDARPSKDESSLRHLAPVSPPSVKVEGDRRGENCLGPDATAGGSLLARNENTVQRRPSRGERARALLELWLVSRCTTPSPTGWRNTSGREAGGRGERRSHRTARSGERGSPTLRFPPPARRGAPTRPAAAAPPRQSPGRLRPRTSQSAR